MEPARAWKGRSWSGIPLGCRGGAADRGYRSRWSLNPRLISRIAPRCRQQGDAAEPQQTELRSHMRPTLALVLGRGFNHVPRELATAEKPVAMRFRPV